MSYFQKLKIDTSSIAMSHPIKSSVTYDGQDNVYLNVSICNYPDTLGQQRFINAEFKQDYTHPIIDNPSDYYLSVVRFQIPGTEIPIFTFNSTPNYYQVNLSFSGVDFPTSLVWTYTADGEVFDYQKFVNTINVAFAASFAALKIAFPAAPAVNPPVLIFNSVTQLFSLLVPQVGYTDGSVGQTTIFWNWNINLYFESIFAQFIGLNQLNGKDVRLRVENLSNNSLTGGIDPFGGLAAVPYFFFQGEFSTIPLWQELKSIVIVADGIPVRPEFLPSIRGNTGQSNLIPVLTDFEPISLNGTEARTYFQYYPTGEYRLIDMLSTDPLKTIGVKLYWAGSDQTLHAIELNPGQCATLKLLFIRKGAGSATWKDLSQGSRIKAMDAEYHYQMAHHQQDKKTDMHDVGNQSLGGMIAKPSSVLVYNQSDVNPMHTVIANIHQRAIEKDAKLGFRGLTENQQKTEEQKRGRPRKR